MEKDKKLVVFKYGGNAMLNDALKKKVISEICALTRDNYHVLIVHGGGPFIKQSLEEAGVESRFVGGQRVTSSEAIVHVEKTLKGQVNSELVSIAHSLGYKAVGLSGKDGMMVIGTRRYYEDKSGDTVLKVDMGRVADVSEVDTKLPLLLLDNGYIPIVACIASGEDGLSYNVNGDMLAGNLAAALKAAYYIVLTDIDGLMTDIEDKNSLVSKINPEGLQKLKDDGIIKGGMIPKIESCENALEKGVRHCLILNGTRPESIADAIKNHTAGTLISK